MCQHYMNDLRTCETQFFGKEGLGGYEKPPHF